MNTDKIGWSNTTYWDVAPDDEGSSWQLPENQLGVEDVDID